MSINCLVVGGSGFLGSHLARELYQSKKYNVTVFDIRKNDKLNGIAETIVGDITDLNQVQAACSGMKYVFHCATAAPTGLSAQQLKLMWGVNVMGTDNVIKGCMTHGVEKLLYVSSLSVHFQGEDLVQISEDAPYAQKPLDYYSKTKILGEKLVLGADSNELATIAIRPSFVYGEVDQLFIPSLAEKARKGKMKYMIGNRSQHGLIEHTYVLNVVHALLLAADKLSINGKAAGKAYFATNQEPVTFWNFADRVLSQLDYPDHLRPHKSISFIFLLVITTLIEIFIIKFLKIFGIQLKLDLTKFRLLIVTRQRTIQYDNALRDLGYRPKYSQEESIVRTAQAFQHLKYSEGSKFD